MTLTPTKTMQDLGREYAEARTAHSARYSKCFTDAIREGMSRKEAGKFADDNSTLERGFMLATWDAYLEALNKSHGRK